MSAARRWLVLCAGVVGLSLGLIAVSAGVGGAAGISICPATGPTCITTSLFPRFVAVGSNGLAVAKFTNRANSTATHTVVSVQLPSGTQAATVTSDPAVPCDLASVSCSFGSVRGGSTVKVFVQFTALTASSGVTATSTVSFDEGNGNTGSPTNDTAVSDASAPIALVDTGASTALNGKCAGASDLAASILSQAIRASYPSAGGGLPCTPVDAGIDLVNVVPGSNHRISFIDLPVLSGNGLATVFFDLSELPAGTSVKTFVLREIPGYPVTIGDPATWPAVLPCVAHAPPAGQDSCVDARDKLGSKGIELTLKVKGLGLDPAYWG